MNGDGKEDLALGGASVRVWYAADAESLLSGPVKIEIPDRCGALCCADLTGDDQLDLGVFGASRGGLHICPQEAGRGVARKPRQVVGAPSGVCACLAEYGTLSAVTSGNKGVYIYYACEQDGVEKCWEWPHEFTSGEGIRLTVLGDGGTPYLLCPTPKGFESSRLCVACRSLRSYQPTEGLGAPVAMVGGDFRGDGDLQLAVLNAGGKLYAMRVLREVEAEQPKPRIVADGLPRSGGLAVADLNADGRDDLVLSGGKELIVLLSGQDGKFRPAGRVPFAGATGQILLADLTGDRQVEVLTLDREGSFVVWKLTKGPSP
jgi:hypothetical protein